MALVKDWRDKELSIQEVIKKYPHISPFVIINFRIGFSERIIEDGSKRVKFSEEFYNKRQEILNLINNEIV